MKLLPIKEIPSFLGISRSALYEKLNPRSPRFDRRFPNPIRLGKRTVRFREDEMCAYLEQCRGNTCADLGGQRDLGGDHAD